MASSTLDASLVAFLSTHAPNNVAEETDAVKASQALFPEAGYKVVIVDNLYNSSKEVINRIELICGKKPEFYELDIQDEAALDKVFKEHPDIDNVIHFAALKVRFTRPTEKACD